MTEFMKFNFHEYGGEGANIIRSYVCVSCLAKEVPLVSLHNCKHSSILENLTKFNMERTNLYLCLKCHKMVEKFEIFKQQLELNVEIINGRGNFSKPIIKTSLQHSIVELNWTTNDQSIEFETKEYTNCPTNQIVPITLETEIKVEHDDCSDFETDVPLSQIKKTKQTKKGKKIKEPKVPKEKAKRTTAEQKYDGILKIVLLTEEEMLEERRMERLKESYLRLPFKCEDCITGFDHDITLNEHVALRHQQKKDGIRCDICKSVLGSKTSYDEHRKRHFRRYECIECAKRYNNVYSLLKHYNDLHGKIDTQYACNLCDYVTESYRSYRYHKDKHRTAKVECEKCGKTFVNKTGLRVHKFTIHGESSRVYACAQCGARYRARSGLAAHAATHAASSAYCAPCNTSFKTAHGLKHHLRTHSKHVQHGDLKYKCDLCDEKFLTKSFLRDHMDWQHYNNIKNECNLCSKVFKKKSSLKKHMEFVHEKKRPPRNKICDHCGRGFTTLAILRCHVRTHTGERPLRCAACPAAFAHSAARYTHVRLVHNHLAQRGTLTAACLQNSIRHVLVKKPSLY